MNGLLKFITCGSVDDGKSTLIGHLLYDAKLLYADQKRALELDSKVGSREGAIDYSLLLDGLMAEREQGITIDVAYRYFTTDRRSFIVADTPGHEEYTRNMAVGASFADLAVILIDATQGVLVQTRRHARICSLMGIRHFVFAVNKMDLIGYRQENFKKIAKQVEELVQTLSLEHIKLIPVSATEGDNITRNSANTPWYTEESLLTYLENVNINTFSREKGFYMPVQRVCRPNHTFRGFQGQVESGKITVGDEITTLPSNEKALVKSIYIGNKESNEAGTGQPITIQLNREVDVSRGCVLLRDTKITTAKQLFGKILWMDDNELRAGKEYWAKLGTRLVPAVVSDIKYKIDVNSGKHTQTDNLLKNEIAYCEITLSENIVVDEFAQHRALGEFILIDRITNMTSACGTVEKCSEQAANIVVKPLFIHQNLSVRSGVFEEFYYDLAGFNIYKHSQEHSEYRVGDTIPVKGESYQYPDHFDILLLPDQVVVKVRDKKVSEMINLDDYSYGGYPLVNESGFAIRVTSDAETQQFLAEYQGRKDSGKAVIYNRWIDFTAYRKIIFVDKGTSILYDIYQSNN